MLLITCPFCGPRSETEFSYGGPAVPARPDAPQTHPQTDRIGGGCRQRGRGPRVGTASG